MSTYVNGYELADSAGWSPAAALAKVRSAYEDNPGSERLAAFKSVGESAAEFTLDHCKGDPATMARALLADSSALGGVAITYDLSGLDLAQILATMAEALSSGRVHR